MKILLINKFLFTKGGDAAYTRNLGALLSARGHDVFYWGMAHPLNPEYPQKEFFVEYVDYDHLRGPQEKIMAALKILYSREAEEKVSALLERVKPDIIHLNNFAHQVSPSVLTVFKRYKLPVVMTMHDYKLVCPTYGLLNNGCICERCSKGKFFNCLITRCNKNSYAKSLISVIEMYLHHSILNLYGSVDVFIAPSRFLQNKVVEMGLRGRVVYIPNYVDPHSFIPQYRGVSNNVVYFGRLSVEKGLRTLIEAISVDGGPSLSIIGDGPDRIQLQEVAAKVKGSRIKFLGFQSGEELKNTIRDSMIVILPSIVYENCPLSVLESFALGKPVIGTGIGGIPELVSNKVTGLTFAPGNHLELREKINFLLQRPEAVVDMGRNARELVENEFNAESHYSRLMELYESVLKKKC